MLQAILLKKINKGVYLKNNLWYNVMRLESVNKFLTLLDTGT